jgi:Tfp pilus assembly protein PilF
VAGWRSLTIFIAACAAPGLAAAQPDAQRQYGLGLAAFQAGDFKTAERDFARSVRFDPDSISPRRDLALAEARQGETTKAAGELGVLTAQARACAGACPVAGDLQDAIAEVQKALGMGAPSAALPLHGDYRFS